MTLPILNEDDRQSLEQVLAWHEDVEAALHFQRIQIQQAITTGATVPKRFFGMTEDEVEAHFDFLRDELQLLTKLNLVACTEAAIKSDFIDRVSRRLKDPLSKAYQDWHSTLGGRKQLRLDFDEQGILDVLKETRMLDNHRIGEFRECLPGRHWIGHGRFWPRPSNIDRFDLAEIYNRSKRLLDSINAL